MTSKKDIEAQKAQLELEICAKETFKDKTRTEGHNRNA